MALHIAPYDFVWSFGKPVNLPLTLSQTFEIDVYPQKMHLCSKNIRGKFFF